MTSDKSKDKRIITGWTGPGSKDSEITSLQPKDNAIHIDMKKKGRAD